MDNFNQSIDFGFPSFSEDQVAKLIHKERQRFPNLSLEMLRDNEISCIHECLDAFPNSRPVKFKLIGETFGDLLCEGAQMLIWMFQQSRDLGIGRHSSKFAEVKLQSLPRKIRGKRKASAVE